MSTASTTTTDPALIAIGALLVTIFFGCVYVWGRVIERLLRREPPVPYEPREPVPWTGPDLVVSLGILILAYALAPALQATFSGFEPPTTSNSEESGDATLVIPGEDLPTPVDPAPERLLLTPGLIAVQAIASLVAVGLIGLGMHRFAGATRVDLGLTSPRPIRDVLLGIGGMLGASIVVYFIQAILVQYYPSEHPLLEMLKHRPSYWNLILAGLMATIIAPLVEEFVFRVLLQGWLEVKEQTWAKRFPRSIGMLPRGTIAITTSAAFFALLHASQGPDPIALFPLAIVLGYLYHQTHRLLPSVAMHFTFNAVSVLVLWLSLSSKTPLPS